MNYSAHSTQCSIIVQMLHTHVHGHRALLGRDNLRLKRSYFSSNIHQGRSHEIWSGLVAVGGDAAKGRGIEACSADYLAQSVEKFFHPHFLVIRMGSLGTFKLFAAVDLYSVLACQLWSCGCQPVCRVRRRIWDYWQNVVVASKSGPVETGPTVLMATALYNSMCRRKR